VKKSKQYTDGQTNTDTGVYTKILQTRDSAEFLLLLYVNKQTSKAILCFRILQDQSDGSSLQSQALQTLQERVRDSESAVKREQESYRQMQVSWQV